MKLLSGASDVKLKCTRRVENDPLPRSERRVVAASARGRRAPSGQAGWMITYRR